MAVFPNNKVDCNMVSVPAQQLSRIVSIYIICTHNCLKLIGERRREKAERNIDDLQRTTKIAKGGWGVGKGGRAVSSRSLDLLNSMMY